MNPNMIKLDDCREWEYFEQRHPNLFLKLPAFFQSMHNVFNRNGLVSEQSERVIFFLGRLCMEDFMEIFLLCGNGYGIGGMKLLRGMYKRAVTLGYIAKNPEKTEEFLEYYPIHAGKSFNQANQVCQMKEHLAPEEIDAIQELYEEAKDKYQEVICETCGTTRTRCSWSELDVASMARVAGLEKLYLRCYYEPTLQASETVPSLITRMEMRRDGHISFDEGAQRENADRVLNAAHNLMLYILQVENDHFVMGLDEEIQQRLEDFIVIWKRSGHDD